MHERPAASTVHLICTTCPSECALTVDVVHEDGRPRATAVTGNRCPRGAAFAKQEVVRPLRILTTTVPVAGGDERLVPVRSASPIPLDACPRAMEELRRTSAVAPIRMGDVVVADIAGTGTAMVASLDVDAARAR